MTVFLIAEPRQTSRASETSEAADVVNADAANGAATAATANAPAAMSRRAWFLVDVTNEPSLTVSPTVDRAPTLSRYVASRSEVVAAGLFQQAAAIRLHGDQVPEQRVVLVALLDR